MADLVTFLLNRLADDEGAAKRAGGRGWTEDEEGCCVDLGGDRGESVETHAVIYAPHIARWDPARVLAECAAKRRIIEEHHLSTQRSRDWQYLELPHGERKYEKFIDEETCAVCGWVREVESQWMEKYSGTYPVPDLTGCLTLRALAAPFAGHPEFDPAWEMT